MRLSLLDLLFPKKCVSCGKFGNYFCRECFGKIEHIEKPVCAVCQRQAFGGKTHPGCATRYSLDGLVVAVRYRGPIVKAIAKVKYKLIWDIENDLVELLGSSFWRYDLPDNLVLVPVPLHRTRLKWRGFNQAEILTGGLAKRFNVSFSDLLIRNINTRSQVGLDRQARKQNVRGAFTLRGEVKVSGKNIGLVDDVFTSGATMAECAKLLKRAGARCVWAIAVALG